MEKRQQPRILSVQRFNQSFRFERKRPFPKREAFSGSGTYGNTSNDVDHSARHPISHYDEGLRGDGYRHNSLPYRNNRGRSFNRDAETSQFGNNFHKSQQRLPRTVGQKRTKPPVPKKPRKNLYDPKEEARLEQIIFGDASDIIDKLPDQAIPEYLGQELSHTEHKDNTKDTTDNEESSDQSDSDQDNNLDVREGRRPVWVDEDDDKLTVTDAINTQKAKVVEGWIETYYSEMLENNYKKIVGTPKWAEFDALKEKETDDLEDEILKHSSHIGKSSSKSLPQKMIELKAMSLLNKHTHNEGPIVSGMEFHPTSTVGLVAGSSGNLSIFQVDGIDNNKLHTMHYQNFPIGRAKFLKDGTEILMGSDFQPYGYSYNLLSGKTNKIQVSPGITAMKRFEVSPDGKLIALCGRTGEIYLLATSSKELIGQLKMNARCRALAFSPNSKTLITHGESNEMYVWDVNSRTCMHRAIDDGCIRCESIAMSPNGQFVATGSKQGVVNVYDVNTVLNQRVPKPLKVVYNLVTSITSLKFNPTSEILAMASNKKMNAFKMLHIPSFNIFPNFPTFQTKLQRPQVIEFSPGGGYLGISNRLHCAFLFRLKHYQNY